MRIVHTALVLCLLFYPLAIAQIGLDAGYNAQSVFSMLVILAIVGPFFGSRLHHKYADDEDEQEKGTASA